MDQDYVYRGGKGGPSCLGTNITLGLFTEGKLLTLSPLEKKDLVSDYAPLGVLNLGKKLILKTSYLNDLAPLLPTDLMFLEYKGVLPGISGYFIASSTILGQAVLSRQKVLLDELQSQLELLVGCSVCTKPLDNTTYVWHIIDHHCPGEILLARAKGTPPYQGWRKVRRRPIFPKPRHYEECHYYRRETGCRRHNQCTFASSPEEAVVWTFERQNYIPRLWLKAEVKNSLYHWTPRSQRTVEKIWAEFGGYFQEICKACFENCPPRVTHWGPNRVCPEHCSSGCILVHVTSEDQLVEIRPKPLRRGLLLEYCMVVSRGQPCQQGAANCSYAHSHVEMAVWEAEASDYLSRPDLIRATLESGGRTRASGVDGSGDGSPDSSAQIQLSCQACHVTLGSQENFKNHCSSQEHKLRVSYAQGALWEHRPPSITVSEFKLCPRQGRCPYRDGCTKAHSLGELQEWILRALTMQMTEDSAWKHGLLFFQDQFFREHPDSGNEVLVRSRSVRDITIHYGQPLQCQEEDKKSHRRWKFIIHSKGQRPLKSVALLKQHMGAMFSLVGPGLPPGQFCAQGSRFRVHDAAVMTFHVEVHVECIATGSYDQWVAFDFGRRPVLIQKLHVQVGQKEVPEMLPTCIQDHGCLLKMIHWHSGTRCVVPSVARTAEEVNLLAKYNVSSQEMNNYKSMASTQIPITLANYRDRMHQFLYVEEEAQQQLMDRLNLQVEGRLSSKVQTSAMGMKFEAQEKSLVTGRIPCSLTLDTDQGSLLSRAISTAYVAPIPAPDNCVYEVQVKVKTTLEQNVWLLLPSHCCSALGLKDGDSQLMEIQFQIDRIVFGRWHQAIDTLHDVRVVLPDIAACSLPSLTLPTQDIICNVKQKQAISYITGTASGKRQVPPLLIYGPFGTGKTYTLAWASLEVIKQPNTKVLICTHTESAADVYIREYFHAYVTAGHPEVMPLRVKLTEDFHETDPAALQYCCLSEDRCSFRFPTQDELEQHPIIITTATSSRNLGVPPGFFSHILIDEAAQMLECEAIMPLAYATQDTRIALAGDHMQSTSKLFSVGNRKSADHSLFNRLFQYYQRETHQLASQCRIIFHENYRTTKAIISFVFHNFYGTNKIPVEDSGIPEHPWQYPLLLCYVSGTPEKDSSMTSWLNNAEIVEVIKRVQEFYQGWVYQWGSPDQKQICVVSHGSQVKKLKEELRKKQLGEVVVENFENVSGREFRVVIISTVHTQDSLLSNSATHLEFFNEPQLLNTVMTRAQSQLVVVGDLRALCAFGHCREIWKNFIQKTFEQGNVLPSFLKMKDMEQSSLLRLTWINRLNPGAAVREDFLEKEDNHNVITSQMSDTELSGDDPLLQELLDEGKKCGRKSI
ncbi:helicase with zinc finger domain 2-like [Dromiciops gliroides]|uniref:helicase with zinc finger domain 2-like n=1 Tax=Dromiciops gliroides TaxID=33562 RepID=UPI001CC49C74|nr:helicase with zinc finger domain 2-like [Dromiciops gliroides]